mgnify:CR=1 FL=1
MKSQGGRKKFGQGKFKRDRGNSERLKVKVEKVKESGSRRYEIQKRGRRERERKKMGWNKREI